MKNGSAMLFTGELNGLANQFVFVSGDIGPARSSQVEDTLYVAGRSRMAEIPRNQATDIFRERYAEIARSPTRTSLHLAFQGDLGARHHDGAIIT
jgi:hypothetical protein